MKKDTQKRFMSQKNFAIKRLEEARSSGEVDEEVIPLIDYINSLGNYYTTSTCYGRIALLQHMGSKLESFHVGKWHREVKFSDVKEAMKTLPKKGITWLKAEPSILHIVARTLENAELLLSLSLSSGFKHSGIQGFKNERFLVEICTSERVDVPIAENGKLLISSEYLKYLIKISNEKFIASQKRLSKLEEILREKLRN